MLGTNKVSGFRTREVSGRTICGFKYLGVCGWALRSGRRLVLRQTKNEMSVAAGSFRARRVAQGIRRRNRGLRRGSLGAFNIDPDQRNMGLNVLATTRSEMDVSIDGGSQWKG